MFENVKKNFGFGCMRLPMIEKDVDYELVNQMVDTFIENGFNYFDTAHGYVGELSEVAVRKCLVERYERDKYFLVNKLTHHYIKKEEDIISFFENQLKICGVEYFDLYLMHSQGANNYPFMKDIHAYETVYNLKKEGRIKHFGISFHDKPEVLDLILTEHPEIECVQIQLNYIDYEDEAIQSRKVLEVCRKHNKPVMVMEPVKGGSLVNLPNKGNEILSALEGGSNASYALRFAAGCEGVKMVLSGMSNMEQLLDNINTFKDFKPLNEVEMEAIDEVISSIHELNLIPCTACRYCVDGCPMKINIPELFACMNAKKIYNSWNTDFYYNSVVTKHTGKALDCIKCGKCEKACPQHLEIRDLLVQVANEFEVKK